MSSNRETHPAEAMGATDILNNNTWDPERKRNSSRHLKEEPGA